jgi:hypothetical protein
MSHPWITRFRSLPRWQKWLAYAAAAILTYTLLGFLVLPPFARLLAVSELRDMLKRDVSIARIRFNPYTLTASISGFQVMQRDGSQPFVAFKEMQINLQTQSLFLLAPVVKEFTLEAPRVNLSLDREGRWNFSDLLPAPSMAAPPGAAPAPKDASKPMRFSLNNIRIAGGEVRLADAIRGLTHHITQIEIALPFLSNLPAQVDIYTQPHLAAVVNGTRLQATGRSKPFADSLQTELALDLQDIELTHYMPYLPPDSPFAIRSGRLDLELRLTYGQQRETGQSIRCAGRLALADLALTDAARRPLLDLKRLDLEIDDLSPLTGKVGIAALRLEGMTFTVNRLDAQRSSRTRDALRPAEQLRRLGLVPPIVGGARRGGHDPPRGINGPPALSAGEGAHPPSAHVMASIADMTVTQTTVDVDKQTVTIAEVHGRRGGRFELRRLADGALNLAVFTAPGGPTAEAPAANPSPPADAAWRVDVGRTNLADYAFAGIDLIPGDPAAIHVDGIQLAVQDFTTAAGAASRIDLSCRINDGGSLETHTEARLAPLALEARLKLTDLGLSEWYPFLAPYLGFVIADGRLAADGTFRMQTEAAPATGLTGVFRGDIAVTDFRSLDRRHAEPFVSWAALALSGLEAGFGPAYAKLDELQLNKPRARITIDPQGNVNLGQPAPDTPSDADQPQAPPAAQTPPPAPPTPVEIKRIEIQAGRLDFADRSFQPGFKADISGLAGRMTGIANTAAPPAEVAIQGRVDGSAPLEISGHAAPLAPSPALDLVVDFSQMDLTAVSPYAARFAGRTIGKGKLSCKLAYRVAEGRLTATNDILIDQFSFGEKVASREALNLPFDLAVALLQDRSGRMQIKLPVSGDLHDPDFSVSGLVLQAFVNLIAKAATAPFALLGAMFGGEELNFLPFDAGSAALNEATTPKLEALAEMLYQRPALNLEIAGYADPATDGPALAQALFDRKLKAQKALDLVKDGKPAAAVDDVVVAPEEFAEYLQRAYEAETFAKPKNMLGFAKTLPPPEAEALIRQNIVVGDAELGVLALERATAVRDYLLQTGRIAAERLFLVNPADPLAAAAEAGIPPGRVVLGLK